MAGSKEIMSLGLFLFLSQLDSGCLHSQSGIFYRLGASSGQLQANMTAEQGGDASSTATSGLKKQKDSLTPNHGAHLGVCGDSEGREVGYSFRYPKSPRQGHVIDSFLRFPAVEEGLFPKEKVLCRSNREVSAGWVALGSRNSIYSGMAC